MIVQEILFHSKNFTVHILSKCNIKNKPTKISVHPLSLTLLEITVSALGAEVSCAIGWGRERNSGKKMLCHLMTSIYLDNAMFRLGKLY